jgi:NitT/TauT family transport system substrate-binding protein
MTWLGEQLGRIADEMPERDLGAKAIAVYQRRRRNVMALAVAAVVAVTLLAATAGVRALSAGPQAAARPSSPPEQSQLTVGVVPSVESAPVFVALGKGYFEEEGLRVKPHIIVSAAHAVPMAESGRLDLAQTDYVTLFTANQAGKKFKIVSSLHQAAQGSLALVVDAKSKIRTMSDLKGKKVMVPALIGLGPLALAGVLKRAGLTLRDVLLIEMPFPEMIHALKSGRAHAALLAEPYVTRGLETGQARVVADAMTRDFANLHTAGMAATGRWAQENPRTGQGATPDRERSSAGPRRAPHLHEDRRHDGRTRHARLLPRQAGPAGTPAGRRPVPRLQVPQTIGGRRKRRREGRVGGSPGALARGPAPAPGVTPPRRRGRRRRPQRMLKLTFEGGFADGKVILLVGPAGVAMKLSRLPLPAGASSCCYR